MVYQRAHLVIGILSLVIASLGLALDWKNISFHPPIIYENPDNSLEKRFAKEIDTLGRLLLNGTHPTGIYNNSENLHFTELPQNNAIKVTLTVSWFGSVFHNNYKTIFEFDVYDNKVVRNFKVLSDTAIIHINPENFLATEALLNQHVEAMRL